jgi:hypothetical protein
MTAAISQPARRSPAVRGRRAVSGRLDAEGVPLSEQIRSGRGAARPEPRWDNVGPGQKLKRAVRPAGRTNSRRRPDAVGAAPARPLKHLGSARRRRLQSSAQTTRNRQRAAVGPGRGWVTADLAAPLGRRPETRDRTRGIAAPSSRRRNSGVTFRCGRRPRGGCCTSPQLARTRSSRSNRGPGLTGQARRIAARAA